MKSYKADIKVSNDFPKAISNWFSVIRRKLSLDISNQLKFFDVSVREDCWQYIDTANNGFVVVMEVKTKPNIELLKMVNFSHRRWI